MKSYKDTVSKFYSVQESLALDEVLTAKTPTSTWIDDFVKSDNSKFAGKSKKERIQMALGAAYAAKRQNEDVEIDLEEVDRLAESFNIEIINEVTAADWLKGAEEARVDAMKAKSEDKMPEFHEHMADHHEHLINYHELKGNQKNADAHYEKMKQHMEDESRLSEGLEELEEGRPSQQHPLEDHPYHKKSNAELEYIAKDAREAAEAMKGHNTTAENKYTDQANDSATVRYWRQKNGMPAWYKKKYELNEEVNEEVFPVEEEFDLDEMVGASMGNTRKLTHHIQGLGWKLSRTTGSHDVFTHPQSPQHIAVPRHKELKAPLVLSILKIAKVPKFTNETEMHEGRGFRGVDGARYREDDEHHHIDRKREESENTGNWYVRVNGKNLKDEKNSPIPFPNKAAANKHGLDHSAKHNVSLDAMHLTKSWMDAPDKMAEAFMPAISASIAGSQGSMGRASAKAALLRQRAQGRTTPRNFVAKHAPTTGAGSHGNKKKEHKHTHAFMEDSVEEGYNPNSVDAENRRSLNDASQARLKAKAAAGDKNAELLLKMRAEKEAAMKQNFRDRMEEAKDAGEYDYEGSMAKTLLQTICRNAEDIKNMLEDDENLPEWVQSKITKAEDYITTSLDYLKSTKELGEQLVNEDLRKWFSKTDPEGDWKRINSEGEAIGPCAREPGEPKPKCMSKEKREELTKSERAAAVATKRKHDPVADRAGKGGKPVNVSNYGKGKLSEDEIDEEVEQIEEKNSPTNPALWSRAKSMARSKFDVYPSAYANGWASKWYKSKGGGWKSVKEDIEQIDELSKKTLSSYIDKADKNVRDLSRKWVVGTQAQKDAAYAKIDRKISDRFDSMDRAAEKLKESSLVPPPTHMVVDSKTGAVVSKHASLKTASRSANRRDQEYGAVRYIVKPIRK